MKHAQRILSRRKKGSANWHRQRRKVARLNVRVADVRCDLLHNASAQLVQGAGLIAIKDLNVAGMMKNRRLAKAIGDASFGELRQQIQYKAGWYSREVVVIDRWAPSSKACSGCGHVLAELPLSVRAWTCPVCGAEHDRDVNAARNLLAWATGGVPRTRNDCVWSR
jgi:putative transposase